MNQWVIYKLRGLRTLPQKQGSNHMKMTSKVNMINTAKHDKNALSKQYVNALSTIALW